VSLRLVEILIPESAAAELRGVLGESDVLSVWEQPAGEGRVLVSVLVDAQKTDTVLDRFEQRFGHRDDFRALLLPVEATLPRPAEPEPPEPAPTPAPKAKKPALRIAREELRADLEPGTQVDRVYLAMVLLSTIVVAIGLIRDNVAIIIGAMVIAPLLTPNMALALGTTLGDLDLVRRALRSNLIGMALAFGLALLTGAFFPFDATNVEIASRTSVGYGDLLLGLAAGCAGALAFTTGVSASLVGVMVAVALLPPLVTSGLLLASGEIRAGLHAAELLATTIICVNLAAVAMFMFQGVRPRTWWEADRAKRATRIAVAIWVGLLVALIALIALYRGGGS